MPSITQDALEQKEVHKDASWKQKRHTHISSRTRILQNVVNNLRLRVNTRHSTQEATTKLPKWQTSKF
ncbi:unnamed protein product [Sympodiomycopsis kandeliae]